MALLIFYLILALGVSFLCSILEAVLLSITPSFVAVVEEDGLKAGRILRELKDDIDRPLSAILTLNTIAHTIKLLIIITWPLVKLSQGITKYLARSERQPVVSREEFSAMAEIGRQEGIFEEGESTIFKNLMQFRSLRAKDIMTPRVVVVKFNEDQTIGEVLNNKEQLRVSRIPIYANDEEDITGYILKNDLYYYLAEGDKKRKLREIKREMKMFPETIPLKDLFENLLAEQEHIVGAVDEYGGFSGIVTMEDVVETLLGMEIVDEIDVVEDMQKLARQMWRERAKRMGIEMPEDFDENQ